MTMFDPHPTLPYGKTADGSTFATPALAREHALRCLDQGAPSTVSVINPTREMRIQLHVERAVYDALDDVISDLTRLVDRGELTAAEVHFALGEIDLDPLTDEFPLCDQDEEL